MILTFLGIESEDLLSNGVCYGWEHLATALNDMVMEVGCEIIL